MAYIDFVVDYNRSSEEQAMEILFHLIINRINANKPTVIYVVGQSGEGKSYTVINIIDRLMKKLGLDFNKHLNDIIVYTPFDYGSKIKALLFDKALKKIPFIMLDEAREVIDAKSWQSFVNRAIAHINATSRGVKPLVIFIVSQSPTDIDKAVRLTLTYYCKCQRPLDKPVNFSMYKLYIDDSDLESPKIRKRLVRGLVRKGKGKSFLFFPKFKFRKARKEIIKKYEEMQREEKITIINQQLETLMRGLEKKKENIFKKVDEAVKYYMEHPEAQTLILRRTRRTGRIKFREDLRKMMGFTSEESKMFEDKFKKELEEKGVVQKPEAEPEAVEA